MVDKQREPVDLLGNKNLCQFSGELKFFSRFALNMCVVFVRTEFERRGSYLSASGLACQCQYNNLV